MKLLYFNIVLAYFCCSVLGWDGIERCNYTKCNQDPCPVLGTCEETQYNRQCPACKCAYCEDYLKENERCLKAGDLVLWKLGTCGDGLVCDKMTGLCKKK